MPNIYTYLEWKDSGLVPIKLYINHFPVIVGPTQNPWQFQSNVFDYGNKEGKF